jgi:seryl-tRNA synthetase
MSAEEKESMERQMVQSRDHVLAAGYRQNMLNFAMNLRLRLEQGGNYDRSLAKSAVKEIKRNFQEMEKRHKNQKKEMGAKMREQMSYMIQEMEEHQARIRNTIRTLENDADAFSPDGRQMLMHVRELEEQIRSMEQSRQKKSVGGSDSMTNGTAYLDLTILQ